MIQGPLEVDRSDFLPQSEVLSPGQVWGKQTFLSLLFPLPSSKLAATVCSGGSNLEQERTFS